MEICPNGMRHKYVLGIDIYARVHKEETKALKKGMLMFGGGGEGGGAKGRKES